MINRQSSFVLKHWLWVLPACLSASLPLHGLESITVTADRISVDSIADVNPDTYNGFATVIDRSEFEHHFIELSTLLDQQASVQTFSTGGIGAGSAASIRGSTGKQVNVFVDGILISSALSGTANLALVPASIIDAIEIYPDYTPVQLSDANLAGAINISSRSPKDLAEQGGKLGVALGSFGMHQLEGAYWGGNNTTHILAAASQTSADNDFHVSDDLFPNITAGTSHSRQNNAFSQNDTFIRLRHAVNDALFIQSMMNYTSSENEIPTIQNKTEPAATLDSDSWRSSVGLESSNDRHNWGIRLYGNRTNNIFRDLFKSISQIPQHVDQVENTLGGNIYYEGEFGTHLLTTSFDGAHTSISKENRIDVQQGIDASRKKITAAISDAWDIVDGLTIYNLARGYHIEDNTEAGTAGFSAACASNKPDCLASEHNEGSLQSGIKYTFANYWSIKANLGRLIRIPTLAEKYGELGNYIGDPDLKPEAAYSFDTGIKFDNRTLFAELITYYRHLDDGIFIAYDGRGVGHPSNISSSKLWGAELSGRWNINDAFSLGASGYLIDSENLSDVKANQGKKLHGIYHNGYRVSFTWCGENQSIVTAWQFDDDLYYTPSNSAKADEKKHLDIGYTYWLKHWSFNAGISNLLNEQYSDYNRMPSMGRFYSTSIKYEF